MDIDHVLAEEKVKKRIRIIRNKDLQLQVVTYEA
jgi:hypothetical protein